jgi:hypothetical protein
VSKSDETLKGTAATGFSSLQYIAPKSQQNSNVVSSVKLVGYYNGKPFSTNPNIEFRASLKTLQHLQIL